VTEVFQTASSAPNAGNWGCESTSSTSKYVNAVNTLATGNITVTLSGDNGLPSAIRGDTLTLVPTKSDGTAYATSDIGSTQVFKWVCGDTTKGTDSAVTKYLPASCRG
jgi:type IV pilus assembly protein PilA